jgi:hypothetical protein
MNSFLDIEQSALRLRRSLNIAHWPELKLLGGLRFFSKFASGDEINTESYLREFVPVLVDAARKSNPYEFLPDEVIQIEDFIKLVKSTGKEVVASADLIVFEQLRNGLANHGEAPQREMAGGKMTVAVNCLFVEYNPDLDLPPRGRILRLGVRAEKISSRSAEDDIVVRNPVDEPDDRFLTQARQSISAARRHIFQRFGLPPDKRYRFDFVVDSAGTRFTGDSLGVAFAVGAVAALAKIEVFREKLAVSQKTAFSGALSKEGTLNPIDEEALKLKIYRAFHSPLTHLVLPREHISNAWDYLSQLEKENPDRGLELVGADSLNAVVSDPRLLPTERLSVPAYAAQKLWSSRRSTLVEVPALIVLLAILFVIAAPARWMPWFDDNPAYAAVNLQINALEVFNRDSLLIWADTLECPAVIGSRCEVFNLDGGEGNEVLLMPLINEDCGLNSKLICYTESGTIRFVKYCITLNEYPGDTSGVLYSSGSLDVVEVNGAPLIITQLNHNHPSRSHIRFWTGSGDSLGWYIHAGVTELIMQKDLNGDGRNELIFKGINRRMSCASTFILNPDSAYGVSPPYYDLNVELNWVKRGNQLKYVLFPVTDLGKIDLIYGYNDTWPPFIVERIKGFLDVRVGESDLRGPGTVVDYSLDYYMRAIAARCSDGFIKRRGELVAMDSLPPVDLHEYQILLRDRVTYWIDTTWITEGQLRSRTK